MEIIDQEQPESAEKDLNLLIAQGYEFRMGDYISRGFDLFKADVGLFVLFTLLAIVISAILASTFVGNILVQGPISMGYAIIAHRIAMKKGYEFGDFFKGFEFFVPLLVASLLTSIFTAIGFIFLIIPGIYLAVAYSGTNFLVVFRKMDFWEAMETSRKLVSKEWFSFFGFMIVLGLINLLGVICLGVGLLFTIPITACAVYAAYADIAGVKPEHP